jgi:Fe-S cluster biosynthesis and repair protein YggX
VSGKTLLCARCARPDAPALTSPPIPGALGEEIMARTCADCFSTWEAEEVRIINELRLNFMDPKAAEVLEQQMRAFLLAGAKSRQQ